MGRVGSWAQKGSEWVLVCLPVFKTVRGVFGRWVGSIPTHSRHLDQKRMPAR